MLANSLTCGNHSDLGWSSRAPWWWSPPATRPTAASDGLAVRDWLLERDLKIFFVNVCVTFDDDLDLISSSAAAPESPPSSGCIMDAAAAAAAADSGGAGARQAATPAEIGEGGEEIVDECG